MSVRIHLDNPHAFYTNLDYISGKIILSLTRDETIAAVVVKLEGESKTVLLRPRPKDDPGNKDSIAMENHKILYNVQQVFPNQDTTTNSNMGSSFTLPAGLHEYPFRFKIPFNNGCSKQSIQGTGIGFAGIKLMDIPKASYRHVQQTLPPSLSGFLAKQKFATMSK